MRDQKNILRLSVIGAALLFYAAFVFGNGINADNKNSLKTDDAKARAAFLESYKVFSSARCINCHPVGNQPLQGENSQPHAFLVERGRDGKGYAAMSCNTCHQEKNSPGEHAPPGAEDWHLPPPEMKMVFENKSAKQLCEQLKNPQMNGGRNLREVANHLDTGLVRWAWNPGGNRQKPSVSYDEFVKSFEAWRDNGAACPE